MLRLVLALSVVAILLLAAPDHDGALAAGPPCKKWCTKKYPFPRAGGRAARATNRENRSYCRFICDQCKQTSRKPCTVPAAEPLKPPITYCTCGDTGKCCPQERCQQDGHCCPQGEGPCGTSACCPTGQACCAAFSGGFTCCAAGSVCDQGTCTTACSPGSHACGTTCCLPDQYCTTAGTCAEACGGNCGPGFTCCVTDAAPEGACVDTLTDEGHCGACGTSCAGSPCESGACVCPGTSRPVACATVHGAPGCCTPDEKCCPGSGYSYGSCWDPTSIARDYPDAGVAGRNDVQCCQAPSIDTPELGPITRGCPASYTCCFATQLGGTSDCCAPGLVCEPQGRCGPP
jgi:hypothetical protein